MKNLLSILFSIALLSSQNIRAHENHGYQPRVISDSVALIVAQRASTSMSLKDAGLGFGQLSESWSLVAKDSLAIFKKGIGFYVVSVFNTAEQRTLYVMMSDNGQVYDANFTAEFDGIE